MSDKNFEQSVRSKMDELSFRPSDDVWTKVEAELDHGKKRRRLWLWIPVAAAMIGLVWIGINNTELKTQHTDNSVNKSESTQKENVNSAKDQESETQNEFNDNKGTGSNNTETGSRNNVTGSKSNVTVSKGNVTVSKGNVTVSKGNETVSKNNVTGSKSNRLENFRTNRHVQTLKPGTPAGKHFGEGREEANVEATIDANKEAHVETITENTSLPNVEAVISGIEIERRNGVVVMPQFSTIPNKGILTASASLQQTERSSDGKKKDDAKKKWNFYASGSTGISGVNDGGILDMRTAVSDYSAPTPVANYGGGRGLTDNYAVILRPVSPGLFLNIQGGVERSIARKWSLGAALGYSRFSTSMKNVGWDKRTITMNYGFLDLPVTLSFNQRNYDLNLGVVSSGIVSYNVNHPGTNSINITDPDDLNRLQFGLKAGADIRLFRKSNHQIKIGPTFRYQFTNLLNNKVSAQHLASGAINLKWYLNKQ